MNDWISSGLFSSSHNSSKLNFVFLLLARHSSNKFDSALASSVGWLCLFGLTKRLVFALAAALLFKLLLLQFGEFLQTAGHASYTSWLGGVCLAPFETLL